MKTIVLTLLTCFFALAGLAQGVRFETGSWAEVLEKAKAENKIIFVDVYTQWCGPCKAVSRDVFPDKRMGDYYNTNFLNYKVDAESSSGKEFVKKYPVSCYPTFFFISHSGKMIGQMTGGGDVNKFINGAELIPVYARHGGLENMKAAVKNGMKDSVLLYDNYLISNKNDKPAALNLYLKVLPDEEIICKKGELVEKISLYDKELMERLVKGLISFSKHAKTESYRIASASVRGYMSRLLTQSIEQGNAVLFNDLLSLREEFSKDKVGVQQGDLKIKTQIAIFGATPEYLKLCYWAKNRVNESELKTGMIAYMDQLMRNNPVDSLMTDYDRHALEIVKKTGESMATYYQEVVTNRNLACQNMLTWIDCFWKVSPSDKGTKSICLKWINYVYNLNAYNSQIAMNSAQLLSRIGYSKEAIALLDKGMACQKEIKSNDQLVRKMEILLQDIKNKKL